MGAIRGSFVLRLHSSLGLWFCCLFMAGLFMAALLNLNLTFVQAAPIDSFSDVPGDNPNYAFIHYMTQENLLSGFPNGTYGPLEPVTRAQMASVLVNTLGANANLIETSFPDVGSEHWAHSAIHGAVQAGYLKGYPDGNFSPEQFLTRAEAVVLLLRLVPWSPEPVIPSDLVDLPSDYWATSHIKAALEARMIALKTENKFAPHTPLNRGELARLFAFLLTKSPAYNKAPLTGILVPVEGPFPEIERTSLAKKQTVTKEETIQAQDRVLTGPNSRAAIIFDDGTTLQIEPNTRLIMTQTEGKKYIKQDGTPGITVHKLLLNLEQGELYGGLAPKINTKEPFRSVKLEDPEQIEITLPEGVTPIQEGFFYCRVLAGQKVTLETRSKATIDPLLLTKDKVWSKPEIISWIQETEERIQAQAPVAFPAIDPIVELPGEEPKEEKTPLPRPDQTPTGPQEKTKTAYLTFDDGPSREITPLILDTAEKYGIKVTFFMLGRQVEKYPEITKRVFEKGHAIGNHSYSHQYQQIYQNGESLMQEVNRCGDILFRVIGLRPQIFRAPGGSYPFLKSQHIERLTEAGFQYYDWNVSPGDATGSRKSASTLVQSVLTQAKNKDSIIVLMHDTKDKRSTAEALPLIIEGLQERGYTFATITSETEPIQFTRKR